MSIQIDDALREGFNRMVTQSGLVLIGAFLVFGFVNTMIGQSLSEAYLQFAERQLETEFSQPGTNPFLSGQQTPLSLGVSLQVAGLLAVLMGILAEGLKIVAIRVFVGERKETIPGGLAGRRIVAATINGVVAGIIVGILTTIGLVFLIVPGIFIALSLFFVRQEIAVEDKNFLNALADSWDLAKGNRWELLGLAVILLVVNALAGSPGTILAFLSPLVGTVISVAIGAATTVFGIAVATRAYDQVRRERAAARGELQGGPGGPGAHQPGPGQGPETTYDSGTEYGRGDRDDDQGNHWS